MKIWVDADACPVTVRDIICKAALRTKTQVTFVSNHFIRVHNNDFVTCLQVEMGFDKADDEIAKRVEASELVITSDIPLASEVIDKGATALNTKGELYTKENIRQILNMRDFLDTMRSSGVETGKSAAYSQRDKQAFANQLDRWLAQNSNK